MRKKATCSSPVDLKIHQTTAVAFDFRVNWQDIIHPVHAAKILNDNWIFAVNDSVGWRLIP